MRKIAALAFGLALVSVAAPASAEPIKFARYPHVSQGKLVFSYHGDIWIANEDGSNPTRLTAHVARDTFPRLSPDGRWVAFTSDRFGNADVFLIPASGGEPKQLTFSTGNDTVLNWAPDGKAVLITTQSGTSPWRSPLALVPIDGGLPQPLEMDGGVQGMIKQDGSALAFNRMGGAYWRKGYRGNRADDVWVHEPADEGDDAPDRHEPEGVQGVHAGRLPDVGQRRADLLLLGAIGHLQHLPHSRRPAARPQQVTTHKDDGVQFPSMSPDGGDDRV